MKILLICSSLEPGRDGVGDYCRRLAGELTATGNEIALLALNDRFVNTIEAGMQNAGILKLNVMRVPVNSLNKQTLSQIKAWINTFNPDWLSLQFVPFGYQPKGLPFKLCKQLRFLGEGKKWHIMFHELWVGMAREESRKLHCWGLVQRGIIRTLLGKLNPTVIHTQTKLYQTLLYKLGFEAEVLPLFGNIPVFNPVFQKTQSDTKITFVIFGLIHSAAPIEAFAAEAAAYAKAKGVQVSLTFVGRCGGEQERWAAAWQAQGLDHETLGEQPPERISQILLNATMGISATALAVIEKSGSVAAMRDHGLPVLSVAKPWHPIGVEQIDIPAGVIAYRPGNFAQCMAAKINVPAMPGAAGVAAQLLKALSTTT